MKSDIFAFLHLSTLFEDTYGYLKFCSFPSSEVLSESSSGALQFLFHRVVHTAAVLQGCWTAGCVAGKAAPKEAETSPGEGFWVFW